MTKERKETKPESLTVDEAAAFASVGVRTIYDALKSKELTGTNIGGSVGWRTTKTDVNKWAKAGFKTGKDDVK